MPRNTKAKGFSRWVSGRAVAEADHFGIGGTPEAMP
jgi:hypothetical protein